MAAASTRRRAPRGPQRTAAGGAILDVVDEEPKHRRPGRPRDAGADQAILEATMEELAEVGFGGLTVDAVAVRAGVGKATIYRRWASKAALVLDAAAVLIPSPDVPDTGSLRSDLVELYVESFLGQFSSHHSLLAGLLAEATVNDEVREMLAAYHRSRRKTSRAVVRRAVERGELPADVDADLVSELTAGPLVYRLVFTGGSIDRAGIAKVVDAALGGLAHPSPRP